MPEIVITVGLPGAGKTTAIKNLLAAGYCRLNRDLLGGQVAKSGAYIYMVLRQKYAEGERDFVLDNTYGTVFARAAVLEVARDLNLPVRVIWLQTTLEQAQFFAARRQIQKYGKLFTKADYKSHQGDPNMFPPMAQFAWRKRFEEPTMAEGFSAITPIPMEINLGKKYTNRAILLDYDGTLRLTKSGEIYPRHPDDVVIMDGRRDLLKAKQAEGFRLLGVSNQSGISCAPDSDRYVSDENARACFDRTNELLGVNIEYLYASERAGAPQTFWRKPCPGMGVYFIEKYLLDPAQCLMIGDMKTDQTFAQRCGFQFFWAKDFFGI